MNINISAITKEMEILNEAITCDNLHIVRKGENELVILLRKGETVIYTHEVSICVGDSINIDGIKTKTKLVLL